MIEISVALVQAIGSAQGENRAGYEASTAGEGVGFLQLAFPRSVLIE